MSEQKTDEEMIFSWMKQTSMDGGIERYDDLHVDRIDPAWKQKDQWITAAMTSLAMALNLKKKVPGEFAIVLVIRLEPSCWPAKSVAGAVENELTNILSRTPPSLYLFYPGKEFWRYASPGAINTLFRIELKLTHFFTNKYLIEERTYVSAGGLEKSLDLFVTSQQNY